MEKSVIIRTLSLLFVVGLGLCLALIGTLKVVALEKKFYVEKIVKKQKVDVIETVIPGFYFSSKPDCGDVSIPNWINLSDESLVKSFARKYCESTNFRAWTKSEMDIMNRHLQLIFDRLESKGLKFLIKALSSEKRVLIYRAHVAVKLNYKDSNWIYVGKEMNQGSYLRYYGGLIIYNRFFENSLWDHSFQLPRQTALLVHELFHLVDDLVGRASHSKEFFDSLGWNYTPLCVICGFKNSKFNGKLYSSAKKLEDHYASLIFEKRYEDAVKFDRKAGLEFGLPSLYSLSNPEEAFAEIGCSYVLDTHQNSALSSKTKKYFLNLLDSLKTK